MDDNPAGAQIKFSQLLLPHFNMVLISDRLCHSRLINMKGINMIFFIWSLLRNLEIAELLIFQNMAKFFTVASVVKSF